MTHVHKTFRTTLAHHSTSKGIYDAGGEQQFIFCGEDTKLLYRESDWDMNSDGGPGIDRASWLEGMIEKKGTEVEG